MEQKTIKRDKYLESGVKDEQIIRFAFDSARDLKKIGEDFIRLNEENQKVDAKKFINYIDSLIDDKKEYYLLFDEVQNLQSFDKTNDSFKKIIIINRPIKSRIIDKGYYIIGFRDFLLN